MDDRTLYDQLSAFVSGHKRELFERIAPTRMRHITVALEDIFQPHNASAVLRTCDLLGIQDVHIIEQRNRYTVNPDVALGASKWIDLHHHTGGADNTRDCIAALRERGYRIVATSPHADAYTPDNIPLELPLALFLGTELHGLSDTVLHDADMHLRIPMHGFTESYNISVSAAIILYTITTRLRASDIAWELSEAEQLHIKTGWARQVVKHADAIEQRLRSSSQDPRATGDA